MTEWLSESSTFKDNCVKSNKRKPILSAAKCRTIALVSGTIRYMRIFAGVPRAVYGSSNDSEVDSGCLFVVFKHEF